jgi:hypothetical protein
MADNKDVVKMVSAIYQAAERGTHGAKDKDGKEYKTGLKREVDVKSSNFDGFKVKIQDNLLTINYQLEMHNFDSSQKIEQVERDIKSTLTSIKKFIQSQYKDITGKTLRLAQEEEPKIVMAPISMVRTSFLGKWVFKISGIESTQTEREENETAKKVIKTLDKKAEKPKNVSRKDD